MQFYNTVEAYLVTRGIVIRMLMLSITSYDFLSKEDAREPNTNHLMHSNYGVYYDVLKDRPGFDNHGKERRVIGMCPHRGA